MARKRETNEAKATVAVGYCRVSTREQVEHGASLAAQEERIRAYCALRGLTLAAVEIEEGVSGGMPFQARPAGARVLEAVCTGAVQAVVVVKLDRAFRDAADALLVTRQWDDAGAALHIVDMGGNSIDTTSAAGRFMLTVLAGAAEMEKNLIGDRTAAALEHLQAQGVRIGRAALGETFTDATDANGRRTLAPVPEEAETVQRIVALRGEGRTLREIADALAAEGRATKRGGKWAPATVAKILERVA